MTKDRIMAEHSYNFHAIHPWMPGTFVAHTITGTMHLVINDPAAESLVRQVRPQTNGDFVGDSDWIPAEYQEIRLGDEASFHFTRSDVYGENPAHTGKWRRVPRVVQITLYDGYPEFPSAGNFGNPRGLLALNYKATS